MARTIHHIVPNGHGGWCIRRDGDDVPIVHTDTKIKAINIGMEITRNQDALVVIHEREHRIVRRDSTPGEIPFPFPFVGREAPIPEDTLPAENPRGGKRARAGHRQTPEPLPAETWLTFDFDYEATR